MCFCILQGKFLFFSEKPEKVLTTFSTLYKVEKWKKKHQQTLKSARNQKRLTTQRNKIMSNNNTVYHFYPDPNRCNTAEYAGKVYRVAAIQYEAEREWRRNDAGGYTEYNYGGEACYVNNYYLQNTNDETDKIWFNYNENGGTWEPKDIDGLNWFRCDYDRNLIFGVVQTNNGNKVVMLYER